MDAPREIETVDELILKIERLRKLSLKINKADGPETNFCNKLLQEIKNEENRDREIPSAAYELKGMLLGKFKPLYKFIKKIILRSFTHLDRQEISKYVKKQGGSAIALCDSLNAMSMSRDVASLTSSQISKLDVQIIARNENVTSYPANRICLIYNLNSTLQRNEYTYKLIKTNSKGQIEFEISDFYKGNLDSHNLSHEIKKNIKFACISKIINVDIKELELIFDTDTKLNLIFAILTSTNLKDTVIYTQNLFALLYPSCEEYERNELNKKLAIGGIILCVIFIVFLAVIFSLPGSAHIPDKQMKEIVLFTALSICTLVGGASFGFFYNNSNSMNKAIETSEDIATKIVEIGLFKHHKELDLDCKSEITLESFL